MWVYILLLCGLADTFAFPQDFDTELEAIFLDCGSTKVFNREAEKCVDKCSEGKVYNVKLDTCVDICSSDETFQNGRCEKKPCRIGEHFDSFLNVCIPNKQCKTIDEVITADDIDLRQVSDECKERKCSDYAHLGFRCVPPHVCSSGTIVTDGKNLIDIRTSDTNATVLESNQCCAEIKGTLDVSDTKCEKASDICCQNPDFTMKTCGVFSGCLQENEIATDYACGRVRTDFNLRIVDSAASQDDNRTFIQPGEFPHMCLVYQKVNGQNAYIGGASLIDRNKVLTVAHKFLVGGKKSINIVNDKDIYVRCGEHDVKLLNNFLEHQESRVEKVHLDPEYDSVLLKNNLAILETEHNFIYQDHISPVCLPKPSQAFEGSTNCVSTGWGTSKFKNGFYSDSLKKVQLPVTDRATCESVLKNKVKKNGRDFILYPSWICVGGQDEQDTCTGDGGSPHVCLVDDKYVQVN